MYEFTISSAVMHTDETEGGEWMGQEYMSNGKILCQSHVELTRSFDNPNLLVDISTALHAMIWKRIKEASPLYLGETVCAIATAYRRDDPGNVVRVHMHITRVGL